MYFIPTSARPFASLRRISRSFALLLSLGVLANTPAYGESASRIPGAAVDTPLLAVDSFQTAVLAGGCFWGVQAVFQHVKGVSKAVSGYAGGSKATAVYDRVSSGRTGHAEAVQITFDPRQISYGKVLQVFFSVAHDPTELNRQGPDVGTQYRSAIFYQDDTQLRVAESYVAQLDKTGTFKRPIVTKLDALSAFYPAEDYHQDYATRHPNQPYIVLNDRPKVENLKRLFPDIYRETPVLVTTR
jgi:peptide-methionine (S)-S-oxide reductase